MDQQEEMQNQQDEPLSNIPPVSTQHLTAKQTAELQKFWNKVYHDVQTADDFKNNALPIARIKKIMKSDEDVRMISSEAPLLVAKACEIFILELTLRAWFHTEEGRRRILQRNDIATAITKTDIYDFLIDIIPRDDMLKQQLLRSKIMGDVPVPIAVQPPANIHNPNPASTYPSQAYQQNPTQWIDPTSPFPMSGNRIPQQTIPTPTNPQQYMPTMQGGLPQNYQLLQHQQQQQQFLQHQQQQARQQHQYNPNVLFPPNNNMQQ